jgi:transcriptional regulator with XRE-family HTH domain
MPTGLGQSIAAEVRAELARQQITQAELAARLETDQAIISRKLTGRSIFTTRDLERWAAALGVPVTNFLPEPAGDTR